MAKRAARSTKSIGGRKASGDVNPKLPRPLRGKPVLGHVRIPGTIADPYAYAVNCTGDCMAPDILDGDVAIISPAVKVERGMIVTINFKDGRQGAIKQLVSDIPSPMEADDDIERMVQFEMLNPPKRLLARPSDIEVLHACVGVLRGEKYISLSPLPKFEKLPRGHKTFVARDDGFSPALRGGDLAVVDMSKREPVEGQLVYYRHNDHEAIVRLSPWTLGRTEPNCWALQYGRQRVIGWKPGGHAGAPNGYITMCDGPVREKFLCENIQGHVVGVLREAA